MFGCTDISLPLFLCDRETVPHLSDDYSAIQYGKTGYPNFHLSFFSLFIDTVISINTDNVVTNDKIISEQCYLWDTDGDITVGTIDSIVI